MKEEQFTDIAKKLDISKSTVSKAYRHCSGVDSVTREKVLQETAKLASQEANSPCDVYCIIPDTPQFFWGELRRGIRAGVEKTGLRLKYNVITRISDTNTVLYYLDEAKRIGAKVIILAAILTPRVRECLSGFPHDVCVIILSEYNSPLNWYYVGANQYSDGAVMGKLFAERYSGHRLIILSKPNRPNIDSRISGFCDAAAELAPQSLEKMRIVSIPADFFQNRKTAPSRLAALLRECVSGDEPICLYVPFGSVQIPLALNKAKISDITVALCHDDVLDSQGLPCVSGAVLQQDMFSQGKRAIELGASALSGDLPSERSIFIESHITVHSAL